MMHAGPKRQRAPIKHDAVGAMRGGEWLSYLGCAAEQLVLRKLVIEGGERAFHSSGEASEERNVWPQCASSPALQGLRESLFFPIVLMSRSEGTWPVDVYLSVKEKGPGEGQGEREQDAEVSGLSPGMRQSWHRLLAAGNPGQGTLQISAGWFLGSLLWAREPLEPDVCGLRVIRDLRGESDR